MIRGPDMEAEDAQTTRSFEVGITIDGLAMDMERMDEVVGLDTTEVWRGSGIPTTSHVVPYHGIAIDGRARDRGSPGPAACGSIKGAERDDWGDGL